MEGAFEMRKQILKMQEGESFPFCWVKFDSVLVLMFKGIKSEIYIKKDSVSIDDMKSLFCAFVWYSCR